METTKFIVPKGELQKKLQKVVGVVPNKCNYPVYTNFLFEIESNILSVTGCDTSIQINAVMSLSEKTVSSSFCIERALLETLKVLPDQPITVSVDSVNLSATLSHSTGEFTFRVEEPTDYAKIPVEEKYRFEVPAEKLKTAFEKNQKQMADDELRPVMNGIFVDIKPDSVVFVASDGHRLSRYEDSSLKGFDAKPFLIPRAAVPLILKLIESKDEDIQVISNNKNVAFTVGTTTLTARLTEGTYPNYDAVIPVDNDKQMVVDTKEMGAILNRLLLAADVKTKLIRIDANTDKTIFSSQDIDYQKSAKETTAFSCTEPIIIGVKGNFLVDLLGSVKENIIMSFSDPGRAILIHPEEQDEDTKLTLLLMPQMLDN